MGRDEPGPRFFPYLLAGTLLLLGIGVVVRGLRERRKIDGGLARPAGLIALTVLYVVAFTPVGFLVSTLLFTSSVVLLLGERGWRAITIPLATTAFMYAAFVAGLGVVLP